MKKKIISLIIALALTVTAALEFFPSLRENSENNSSPDDIVDFVVINEESFPDENFRSFVLELEKTVEGDNAADGIFDKDELAQITSIIANSLEIQDLKGIEYFTHLEVLNFSGNSIKAVDLANNENLKELICSENELASLDLSKLTSLEKLDCGNNRLSELVLNDNPLLTELCCSDNPITALDISENHDLWRFEGSNTNLTSLNIENHNPYDAENEQEFDFFELNNSSYTALSCNKDAYDFDLTALPGDFNVEKASGWNGAEPINTVLNGITNGNTVTYSYDVGCGITVDFSISFEEGHNLTIVDDRSEVCSSVPDLWHCLDCGKYFADEEGTIEVEVSDSHDYDEGVVEKEASCTEEGVLLKTCTVCGFEHREVIEMLPHNTDDKYEFDEYQHWKICQDCGQEIDREDHSFEEGSNICLICGEAIEVHYHKLKFVEEKAPTCTEEGIKEHYYCAECDKYFTDSEGEDEISYSDLIIEKLEHQYEIGFDETEHWQECALCGDKKDIQAHDLEEQRTEPTCFAEGSLSTVCTDCGYIAANEIIPATGEHDFSDEYGSDDDHHWFGCTTEGCTARIDQTEHSYTKLEIVKSPTCSEEGIMNHTCEICGHTKSEAIPISENHTYLDEYIQIDENTHAKVCSVCGLNSESEAHEFDKGAVVKEAACDDGIFRYTCICGYYKDEAIPAISAHDFYGEYVDLGEYHSSLCKNCGTSSEPEEHTYDIQIVKETCVQSGKLIYSCKYCDHSYEEETEPPTGIHSFSDDYTVDGDNHIHPCTAEGCTATDTHNADECTYNTAPVYGVDDGVDVDISVSEAEAISIVWPTSVGVVFNPYRLKIKVSEDSENHTVSFTESKDGSADTVLSNELTFINKGDSEIKITVTGSVSAVTTVDADGNTLLDSNGNPTTRPSEQITFTDKPINDYSDSFGENETSKKNSILLYLEATTELDSTGTHGVYKGIFDKKNENQMLLSTQETTKNLFNIAPKEGDKDGATNLKICGDMETDPDVSWYKLSQTDQIKIMLVFEASPVDDPSENANP